MGAIKTQNFFQFTFEKQSAWDTAIDTAPKLLLTEDDMPINVEPNHHAPTIKRGINGPSEKDAWNDLVGVIPTATVTSYMNASLMSGLLPAICQKTPTWSGIANIWSIHTNGDCAYTPNPKDDGTGYFYTLTRRYCDTGNSVRIKNAIPTNMTFTCDVADKNGALYMTSDWIGQGYQSAQSPTGTIVDSTFSGIYSYANIGAVSFGSYDLTTALQSFEISLANGAGYVKDLPTGPIVFNGWEVTGNFVVTSTANTETMKALTQSDVMSNAQFLTISYGDGTVSSAGEMNLYVFCYLTNAQTTFTDGEEITFSFIGKFGNTASNEYPFRAQFYL